MPYAVRNRVDTTICLTITATTLLIDEIECTHDSQYTLTVGSSRQLSRVDQQIVGYT